MRQWIKAFSLSLGFLACIFLPAGCGNWEPETEVDHIQVEGFAPGESEEKGEQTEGMPDDQSGMDEAGMPGTVPDGDGDAAGETGTAAASGEVGAAAGTEAADGTGATAETGETGIDYENISITISAAGDVTLGNHKDQGYGGTFREMYDTTEEPNEYFLKNVKEIFEADDMTIVNLEGPLTLSEDYMPDKAFNMRGDPEYAEILLKGDVEAVSMGNNHRMDYKEQGVLDTVEALENVEIVYAYDDNIGIYETKGIRIGFVSVNQVYDGTAVEKFLEEGIKKLREDGVELVLACCHWGIETEHYPNAYQKELGRKCIDWGADLVIGHHPHVLQGIEQYEGKYIIYSLGNFCFGGNRNPKDKDTMIFQQTFTFSEEGEAQPGDARVIPCSISSVGSRNNFQPTPLEGEDYDRVLGLINKYSRDYHVEADENGILKVGSQTGE